MNLEKWKPFFENELAKRKFSPAPAGYEIKILHGRYIFVGLVLPPAEAEVWGTPVIGFAISQDEIDMPDFDLRVSDKFADLKRDLSELRQGQKPRTYVREGKAAE